MHKIVVRVVFLQRLGDLSALTVFKAGIHIKNRNLPPAIKNLMEE